MSEVIRVSEPTTQRPPQRGATLERTRAEILDGARPLPPEDQSLIEQLSDDEARLFLDAILDT